MADPRAGGHVEQPGCSVHLDGRGAAQDPLRLDPARRGPPGSLARAEPRPGPTAGPAEPRTPCPVLLRNNKRGNTKSRRAVLTRAANRLLKSLPTSS